MGDRLTISDFLIKPIDRIKKYPLLLQKILEYTEKQSEVEQLEQAIEIVDKILKQTNEMMEFGRLTNYDVS